MSVYFADPLWLLLLVPVVAGIALARRSSLVETSKRRQNWTLATRLAEALLVVLALAGLSISFVSRELETIFLVDASASIDERERERIADYITRVDAKNPKTIYFASRPFAGGAEETSEDDRNGTDLEKALFAAQGATDPSRRSQIVLFSDGNETKGDYRRAIADRRAPISVVPLETRRASNARLTRIEAPSEAVQGEPVESTVVVDSAIETSGTISLYRNGFLSERREEAIKPGENRFSFLTTPSGSDENLELTATLESSGEIEPGFERARALVALSGRPKILVVAKDPDLARHFVAALKAQDLETELRPLEALPDDPIELSRFDEIALLDVPATSLAARQTNALTESARDFGVGILAIGGENSFGADGGERTGLDALLPVETEYEKEKEKPNLAIALVVDRSGSMEGEKLDMTKKAAQGVVELLTPRDFISVIAFDDAPREVVPTQNVVSPVAINSTIGAISSDGSTNIYPALAKATDDLLRVNAKFKHIILLTDGQSVPGEYERTIRRAVAGKITLSTVGVGSDADKFLLEKLASEGSGRHYFCDDPNSIPQIFARETRLADRSTIDEEPFLAFEESPGARILGGLSLEEAPPLLGAVVVKAKPTSEIDLTTERGDPLLAHWRFGLGIVVAFASDVDGRWSAEWLDWPDFSAFWAQVARFAMRRGDAANARVSVATRGETAVVRLDVRDEYDRFINDASAAISVVGEDGSKRELTANRLAPGVYAASFPTKPDVKYAIAATAARENEKLFATRRALLRAARRETDAQIANEEALRTIAETTGGEFDPSPGRVGDIRGDVEPRKTAPARAWLLCFALAMFTIDVYLRRLN